MSDVPRDPTLTDLLELTREQTLEGIRTHIPGVITSYDKDKQRASVQVLIKDLHVPDVDTNDGEDLVPETVAVLVDVPVMHAGVPRGRITFPVKVGDYCLVEFCSSATAVWNALGGGSPQNPGDPRRHDLSDAVALVGLHNFAEVPTDAPDDAVVVHLGAGVTFKQGSSSASESALLGDSFVSACDTFADALSAFAATCVTTPPTTPNTAFQLTVTAFKLAIAAAKSSKIKLE